ncbi:MAG TPA: UvrB/UvrC motif-containing protein [Candidatus Omnitrophota bacterium]|nr:UvrB/UvrC motif-containing protein [Candidatus Omnitrophota bacterium]HPD84769.1 UvrB/UvrC motif-containing protein [Candidatus Omnitrophota bacterium]HRZ03627.1 UvrB/UvrC motif-containing protein [Candidatus Omnitrophota bacterium]
MQCDICGNKKATVHLTEIVDEQMSELHLCEDCAREKSVQMEQQFGLADLLAGLTDFGKQAKDVDKVKTKCTNCGLTYEDFRKLGRLGCGECYSSFREYLTALLKKIHGSNQHFGKVPAHIPVQQKEKIDTLQDLRTQLQRAIHNESFEEAARLRDKIHELEKKGDIPS